MRHTAILNSALAAGLGRPVQVAPDGIEHKLYTYARERKFPPPETLARKAAELAGGDYPYPSIAAAPEAERVFFTAFRAVAEALEPFHEDDPADEPAASVDQQGLSADAMAATDASQGGAAAGSADLPAADTGGGTEAPADDAEHADTAAATDPATQAEDPTGLDGAETADQDGETSASDAEADQAGDSKSKKKSK